jgi:Na+/H+ antiporter NhaD/arsenite permease-like protein
LSSLSWDTISSPRDVTSAFDRVLSVLLLANVVRSAHAPKSLLVSFGVLVALSFLSGRLRTIADLKKLRFHQALMVGVFLASLVFFGGHQRWWLEPIITRLSALPLFVSAIALTGIIDNAAITFLGAQVPTLTAAQKYLLVAGSVVGGGLTVIANAPNPVGYEILGPEFGKNGISPSHLLRAALVPTLISAVIFWI